MTTEKVVAGVNLGRIVPAHMREQAKEILGRDVSKLAVEDVVIELNKKFAELPRGKTATCDTCGGISDERLDSCPFCLEGEEPEEDVAAESEVKKPKTVPAERPSRRTVEKALNGANGHAGPSKAALVKPKTVDPDKARLITFAIKDVQRMVEDYEAKKVAANEAGLDEAVKNVSALKAAAAISWWRIGDYMKKVIFDTQLWAHRSDPENPGKPLYKGFDQFTKAELGVSGNWSFRLMHLASQFSEAEVPAFGISTLKIIAGLPKDDQEEVLKKIKSAGIKNAAGFWTLPGGQRTIGAEVKKHREAKGLKSAGPLRGGGGAGGTEASAAKRKRFTVIFEKERGHVPAMKYAAKDKAAKRLADDPFFEIVGTQAKLQIRITENAKGELVAHYIYKRLEEE